MPELPEVETIRRQLAKKIIGRKLQGKEIVGVRRRGKILIIDFKDGSGLLLHLKLTGQLIFGGEPSKHTRHIFKFDDDGQLVFNDKRKFGWWKKVRKRKEIEKELSFLGPESLKIDLETFKKMLKSRPNSPIKPLLMDQKFIAGIGNIYSDEILHGAKVHPLRRSGTLSEKEIELILENTRKILKAAIRYRGSSVENYLDALGKKGNFVKYHKVYQREGKKCLRCGVIIQRIKIGGRSAHFCPKCQKL